jgi:maleate isomerase
MTEAQSPTNTRIRLGMLTPSSNTVLEPTTAAMLAGLPDVTAHFGRFRVTRIALATEALAQFDPAPVLQAASLLADAHMNVIAWNGTSAGWLGFDSDERLCAAITAATGARATSSVLAINDALDALGARTIGLVSPYTPDVQDRIVANYAASGRPIIAERHLNDPGNYSFAQYEEPQVAGLVREVAAARPDAIVILCTNMRGARAVPQLERELGIPVLDSIAVTLWKCLALAGVAPGRVQAWGQIFALQQTGASPGTITPVHA